LNEPRFFFSGTEVCASLWQAAFRIEAKRGNIEPDRA
jgi:hypothetical protein